MDLLVELERKLRKRAERKANSRLVFWWSRSRRKLLNLMSDNLNRTDAYLEICKMTKEEVKLML